jgi:predicted nucleic acid-binding protein
MGVVVDASVVGCWCFPDEASPVAEAALEAVGADGMVVPAVWWFEVLNLLLTGERHGRLDPAGSAEFLADLDRMVIRIDAPPARDAVLGLARAHRVTVYDAAYLELARRVEAPLATLDRRLAAAAGAAGVALVGE